MNLNNMRRWGSDWSKYAPVAFEQLGGVTQPEEGEEEELPWWKRLGQFAGESDQYNKEMGIPYKDFAGASKGASQMGATGGMGASRDMANLLAMAKIGSNQRRERPRMDPRSMILSGHLKTLMGG